MNVAEPKTKTDKQREELIEIVKALPEESLQELAIFLQYLKYKASSAERKQPSETHETVTAKEKTRPAYKIVKESGFIGCAEGPPDLAANHKAYLEEYLTKKFDRD